MNKESCSSQFFGNGPRLGPTTKLVWYISDSISELYSLLSCNVCAAYNTEHNELHMQSHQLHKIYICYLTPSTCDGRQLYAYKESCIESV